MRTLACFHVVKPCLWNSDHEWKISICRQFPNSISLHVCTRLRCYIVATNTVTYFVEKRDLFSMKKSTRDFNKFSQNTCFHCSKKKIKFKKCARAILDSDNKMPSCCIYLLSFVLLCQFWYKLSICDPAFGGNWVIVNKLVLWVVDFKMNPLKWKLHFVSCNFGQFPLCSLILDQIKLHSVQLPSLINETLIKVIRINFYNWI